MLFGPPLSVYAELARARPGARVDDDVFVALTHPGGVRSHLGATMLAAAPGPRIRLEGTAGTYEKSGLDGQEDALRAGGRPDDPEWGREPGEAWGRLYDGGEPRAIPTERGAYPAFYAGVARALREGGPPPGRPARRRPRPARHRRRAPQRPRGRARRPEGISRADPPHA